MSDDNTPVTHKYDKFVHTNGVAYAFLEAPVSILNEKIPEDANWSNKGTDEEPEQKTLNEYTINKAISKDETKVVFALCAMEAPSYRKPSLTYDDLQDWETWLDTKGYSIDDFLTVEDRNTLLASEAYGLGDE
jgi:hypothetical protein|tara:strand:- start:164 stop:562 length:399 start_codon:yes stop_codon:yes gene_type:complete